MTIKMKVALVAAAAIAGATMFPLVAANAAQDGTTRATDFSSQNEDQKKKKVAPKPGGPGAGAPRQMAPRQTAPRTMAPQKTSPQFVKPKTAPKVVGPKIAPKVVGPQGAPKVVGPKVAPAVVGPKKLDSKVGAPKIAPRVITRTGPKAGIVTAGKLRGLPTRGAGKTFIAGKNYSVWRRDYRVRRDGRWWTIAALSTLGAIAISGAYYYPYAYIEAPQAYCEGLTEDGCELMWQEVETVDGDYVEACVAYCPWQQ